MDLVSVAAVGVIGYFIGTFKRQREVEAIIAKAFPAEWEAAKRRHLANSGWWVTHPWDHRSEHPVWFCGSAFLVASAAFIGLNYAKGVWA